MGIAHLRKGIGNLLRFNVALVRLAANTVDLRQLPDIPNWRTATIKQHQSRHWAGPADSVSVVGVESRSLSGQVRYGAFVLIRNSQYYVDIGKYFRMQVFNINVVCPSCQFYIARYRLKMRLIAMYALTHSRWNPPISPDHFLCHLSYRDSPFTLGCCDSAAPKSARSACSRASIARRSLGRGRCRTARNLTGAGCSRPARSSSAISPPCRGPSRPSSSGRPNGTRRRRGRPNGTRRRRCRRNR